MRSNVHARLVRIVANCHGIFNGGLQTNQSKQLKWTIMIVYAAAVAYGLCYNTITLCVCVCCFIDSSGCINYAVKIQITQKLKWNKLALNAKKNTLPFDSVDITIYSKKKITEIHWQNERKDKPHKDLKKYKNRLHWIREAQDSLIFVLYSVVMHILCQVFR